MTLDFDARDLERCLPSGSDGSPLCLDFSTAACEDEEEVFALVAASSWCFLVKLLDIESRDGDFNWRDRVSSRPG